MIPLIYQGKGRFEAASAYHANRLESLYGAGEMVTVEEVSERSLKSHNAFFAQVADAWSTLPETLSDNFPSAEHLRKWALIKAGYRTETHLVFRTNAEAITAAAFIGNLDSYAICEVSDRLATVWRAESQSMKAMNKERFQQSKDDCLRVISNLIGADIAKDRAA